MSSVVRKIISTAAAPKAIGPYSQGVLVNGTLYVCGQLGLDPKNGELVSGGAEAECRQALQNMGAVLKAAGASYNNVVKTTVLLSDIRTWPVVNKTYESFFKDHHPARTAFQVAALPKNAAVEIEAIAVIGDIIDLNP